MAAKKRQKLPSVEQNLRFLGLLALGFTLSIFVTVSGLASIYAPVRKVAQKGQIPFVLVGEPVEPEETEEPQPPSISEIQEPEKLENLEQVGARLFSTREDDLKIADLNNDGIVNIVDYLLAKKIFQRVEN